MVFDKKTVRRAAGKSFQPESASSRKKIEHARPLDLEIIDAVSKDIEEGLADLVGCWPRQTSRDGSEGAAAKLPANDPH